MSELDTALQERLDRANARRAKATLSEEDVARAKVLAQVAEAEAESRADEVQARALRGAQLKAEAAKVAAGRYLVGYFDLGALLPDADPEKLPGLGILILRSPPMIPSDALSQFYREIEAKERQLIDIYTDLVCKSVVVPDLTSQDEGMFFRDFLESSIGRGTAVTIGDAVTALGGSRARNTKRGRG